MCTSTESDIIQPVHTCSNCSKSAKVVPKSEMSRTQARLGLQNRVPFERAYRVGEVLGKGGFGTVYAGKRSRDGRCVAIKHVARNKVTDWAVYGGRRVPMELKLLHSVQTVDGVIKLIDFYERTDSFIFVMEKPENTKDLFDVITDKKFLEEDIARNFFKQIVETVLAVHAKGVIHRDIKDENILVNLNTGKLKLIDFGSGAIIKDEAFTDFDGKYSFPNLSPNFSSCLRPSLKLLDPLLQKTQQETWIFGSLYLRCEIKMLK